MTMYQIERNSDITGPVIPFSKDLFLRAELSGPSRLSEAAVADADGKILFAAVGLTADTLTG